LKYLFGGRPGKRRLVVQLGVRPTYLAEKNVDRSLVLRERGPIPLSLPHRNAEVERSTTEIASKEV
jgi:hypothetical protein